MRSAARMDPQSGPEFHVRANLSDIIVLSAARLGPQQGSEFHVGGQNSSPNVQSFLGNNIFVVRFGVEVSCVL